MNFNTILIAGAAAIAFTATPAQAQLLGGGAGGGLGGGLGGTIGGTLGETTGTVRSATRGAVDGNASTRGSQRADTRRGRVEADRSVDGGITGNIGQVLDTPIGSMTGDASGSGNASGNGSASAELIGTDAVRGVAGAARDRVRSTAQGTVQRARGAAGSLPQIGSGSGSASGSASGNGGGSANGSLTQSMLAVAGSGAAGGEGAFAVAPGMPVIAPDGQPIGRVRQIVADNRGRVQQVLVQAGQARRMVPAADLAASGTALVMGSGSGSANTAPAQDAPANESAGETPQESAE